MCISDDFSFRDYTPNIYALYNERRYDNGQVRFSFESDRELCFLFENANSTKELKDIMEKTFSVNFVKSCFDRYQVYLNPYVFSEDDDYEIKKMICTSQGNTTWREIANIINLKNPDSPVKCRSKHVQIKYSGYMKMIRDEGKFSIFNMYVTENNEYIL